jgi:hypothetical protein
MTMVSGIEEAAQASSLWAKYGTRLEEESAAEQLRKRIEQTPGPEPPSRDREPAQPTSSHRRREDRSDPLTDFLTSRQGKALQREVVRGAFSLLKKRL